MFLAAAVLFAISPLSAFAEGDAHYLNIGSVSKMYAVTAVMQLADEGKVDLDASVCEYIDDFTMADERYKDITVRMLMDHTSGLMGSVYADAERFGNVSTDYHDNFLKVLSGERLKADPGTYNCYCNDGFTLLEIITERVSGMSFSEYLEKNIAQKIGTGSTCTIFTAKDMNDQAPYFIKDGVTMAPECLQLVGAGGVMSAASDVAAFGSTFFTGDKTLLSESAKRMMSENHKANEYSSDYGLGWDSVLYTDYENEGVKVVTKGGDTSFQHAFLAVAPEEKISVAVVCSNGSSGDCMDVAFELMDIALEEKGIAVSHPKKTRQTVDTVPESYLKYAGIYGYSTGVAKLSFPENKLLMIETLTDDSRQCVQYMYTTDGDFVNVTGDVLSGNAIVSTPLDVVTFAEEDGKVFIVENDIAGLQKYEEPTVSDAAVSAWEARNGSSYFLAGSNYSDIAYITLPKISLHTDPEARGFVNGCVIADEDHAVNMLNAPSDISRDITDFEIIHENGCEYLSCTDNGYLFISEENIGDFTKDITEVTLNNETEWYKLNGLMNETITLDIEGNAMVSVFDKYGDLKYSSFMNDYGNTVPLPNDGMIVFAGEAGSTVKILR